MLRHGWQVGKPAVSADTMQVSLAVALEGSKPVTEGTRGLQWCIRTFTGNRE